MKKYLSFFRLRFSMGLQYRAAALAGIVTQFVWGLMEITVYHAFYRADASAFPMKLDDIVSYLWLQQAFLALFMAWMMENEIFDSIKDGNIAYELCRPISIYHMWFGRSLANRISKAVLRCFPILLVAWFLPKGYCMYPPKSWLTFFLFLLTVVLGLIVTVALCMIVYMLTFFTISPQGLRILFLSVVELFAGSIIPLPFFPDQLRKIIEFLPFASMQNVGLRIYSGNLSGAAMYQAIGVQIFWVVALILIGEKLGHYAIQKVAVQGG